MVFGPNSGSQKEKFNLDKRVIFMQGITFQRVDVFAIESNPLKRFEPTVSTIESAFLLKVVPITNGA